MSRTPRIILIIIGTLVVGTFIVFGIMRFSSPTDDEELTEAEINQLKIDSIVHSAYERLLFYRIPSGNNVQHTELYISDFLTADTASIDEQFSELYSNFVPEHDTWFSVQDSKLYKHNLSTVTEIKTLENTVAATNDSNRQSSLAVDAAIQQLAWATGSETNQEIVVMDIVTGNETIVYGQDDVDTYSNITWSENGEEIAFINEIGNVVTITTIGAQLENPFTIPFSEINHLTWLDANTFGAVLTSSETNLNPFNPKVVVFDRTGIIIEEHDVLENAGLPRLIWSPDDQYFMFYHPWKNQFLIYDRFDELRQIVLTEESGKLIPLGWTNGLPSNTEPISINTIDLNSLNINALIAGTEKFEVSAEEWEVYNETTRGIINRFDVSYETYRFSTDDDGIHISYALPNDAENPEYKFIRTIIQSLAMMPTVPAVTVEMVYNENANTLKAEKVTRETVATLIEEFTDVTLDEVFITNKDNPYGKLTNKPDNKYFTHLGDVVYGTGKGYNPVPALAALSATMNGDPIIRYENFAFIYPALWEFKDRSDTIGDPYSIGDLLFYNTSTIFLSQSAWQGFSVTLQQYRIPEGITIDNWIEINRADRTSEDIPFPTQPEINGKHLVAENEYTEEYVLTGNGKIYTIIMEHLPSLSEEERAQLQMLVTTFSDAGQFIRD